MAHKNGNKAGLCRNDHYFEDDPQVLALNAVFMHPLYTFALFLYV
jgi:hypothetical protein